MSFPPPPPPPNEPPAPQQWQPGPQGQPPHPQQQPSPPQQYQQPAYQQPAYQQPAYQQPAYQQQAYQQVPAGWQPPQPVAATAPAGRGWVVPTIVVAALVTIGGVFAASAAREGTESTDAAADARDAVVRLTTAMAEGDCAGVEDAATGGYFRVLAMTCEDIEAQAAWMDEVGMSFVVGEAEMDRDSADVPVEIVVTSDPGQGGRGVFTVVRTGDTWRVSNDQSA